MRDFTRFTGRYDGFSSPLARKKLFKHQVKTNKLCAWSKTICLSMSVAVPFKSLNCEELRETAPAPVTLYKFKKTTYLTNWRQYVKIDDNWTNDDLPTTYGVLQGRTFGPTLYFVYIDSLCRLSLLSVYICWWHNLDTPREYLAWSLPLCSDKF